MNYKKKLNFIFILELLLLILFLNNKYKKAINILLKGNISEKFTHNIPVFTFHRLVPDDIKREKFKDNEWVGSIKVFEDMIKYLYEHGYKSLNIKEFYKWYIGEIEYDKKTILITIDDGHYEDYYLVYPIIKKYNLKAISFVVGSRIKQNTALYNKYNDSFIGLDVINRVRIEYPNFEFQSHSFNMHYIITNNTGKYMCRIQTMSYKDIEKDSIKNKKYGFTAMAYPYGALNKDIMEILKNQGYLMSFRFGIPRYATRKAYRFAIPRIKLNGSATLNTLKMWLKYI